MKKITCLLVALMMIIGTVFCQENDGKKNEDIKPQVEFLINQNLKQNIDTISVLSLQLPATDKISLYNTYKKEALKPVLLNTLVGFGLGSYLDGDLFGGILGSCLDGAALLGWIFAIDAYTVELDAYKDNVIAGTPYVSVNGKYITHEPDFWEKASVPFLLSAAARIYGGLRANRYVKKYNKKLVEALNLESLSTSLLPVMKQDGSLAMAFNVQLNF